MAISPHDIRTDFVEKHQIFGRVLRERLLAAFDNIEEAAERETEATWDRLGEVWDPDDDPSCAAEMAWDAGLNHYQLLSDMRQTILNLSAAALFHLFEQQMIVLLRLQILHPSEENDAKKMKLSVLWQCLKETGIDHESFSSWRKVDELRCLANSVKHAEGPSSSILAKRRPDLFTHPVFRENGRVAPYAGTRFYLPMAGKDIFVQPNDIDEYVDALVSFLLELACELESPSSPPPIF
jgi:hypothetical protein